MHPSKCAVNLTPCDTNLRVKIAGVRDVVFDRALTRPHPTLYLTGPNYGEGARVPVAETAIHTPYNSDLFDNGLGNS